MLHLFHLPWQEKPIYLALRAKSNRNHELYDFFQPLGGEQGTMTCRSHGQSALD